MFRGKESSNRIELSRLVQDLLNFGVLGSLRLWWVGREGGLDVGVGGWGWVDVDVGGCGCPPHMYTCMHMHTHTCMHAHTHTYRNCKWLLTWRHPCLSCLCMYMHIHACACVHAWNTPHTPIPIPTPIHPSTSPLGGTLGIS